MKLPDFAPFLSLRAALQPAFERWLKPEPPGQELPVFFLGLWCLLCWVVASGLPRMVGVNALDTLYSLLLILTYGCIYLLPILAISWLLRLQPRLRRIIVLALSALTIAFLFADNRLFGLYGFHFNGFVWNLLTTHGGLASLGADQVNPYTLLKYAAVLICALGGCYFLNQRLRNLPLRRRWIVGAFLLATLTERIIYSFAYAGLYGPILSQADHMILYQPLTMNSFLTSVGVGITAQQDTVIDGAPDEGRIKYPFKEIELEPVAQPYNIIFLVAESLRYRDVFNARVMPNTLKFAADHGTRFTQHFSGGNGTRQALFAMFYGLYGNYWDRFLRDRTSPVLFDVLNEYNYQYFLYTSSYFTYPEFDKTIFGSVPQSSMVETNDGEAWTRDDRNVEKLLGNISRRDRSKPFLGFVFFEATHARYSFPKASVIDTNYTPAIDYAELKSDELLPMMDGMRARYLNSAHYVDSQFQRVYRYLEANNMLENTIVIVTGDHGEEFMEKERWGHNSSFVDEQIRVPLIVSHPDYPPGEVTTMTSHMDIPGMLMHSLGVKNPLSDYSLGGDLLQQPANDMVVVASWTDLGIVSPRGKLVIPFRSTTQHRHLASTRLDEPADLGEMTEILGPEIARVIGNTRRFVTQ